MNFIIIIKWNGGYFIMNQTIILSESDYQTEMDTVVLPYLASRKKELFLEREKGKAIHCIQYQCDTPVGAIVLSHGFTESAEKYQEIAYYFLRKGLHVLIPEHCGHGKSYRLSRDPSLVHIDHFERYIKDLLFVGSFAKKEYPQLPLYLYGHSMGGGIAAAAAAFEPQLFEKVILSSPMICPATANVPTSIAKIISSAFCMLHKGTDYVAGQHSYDGTETFEDSASLSEARFSYYKKIRSSEPLYQMNAASYSWLHQAFRLNHFLQKDAWKQIQAPLLIFQAGCDTYVINSELDLFVQKINQKSIRTTAQFIKMPNARHEIYNSTPEDLKLYWNQIFQFLDLEKC
jgi:lysophospholipase